MPTECGWLTAKDHKNGIIKRQTSGAARSEFSQFTSMPVVDTGVVGIVPAREISGAIA